MSTFPATQPEPATPSTQHTGRTLPDVPLAQAHNHTPFPAQYFQTVDQHGEAFHVMALKATYDMQRPSPQGHLNYAVHQAPLSTHDSHAGAPGASSPLWESDFAPYKPKCDVLLVGAVSRPPQSDWNKSIGRHLHPDKALQPRQAQRWPAAFALKWQDAQGRSHDWHKTLTVTGPRAFGLLGLNSPEAASEVALCWENAYGGLIREPEADIHHPDGRLKTKAGAHRNERNERNPVGCGLDKRSGRAGPQLETSALNPYHAGITQGEYPPVGVSAVGRHWTPRLALAGTYDAQWQQTQWPLPPTDVDHRYWNCAPEDQQIEHPSAPGLRIFLANICGAQQLWSEPETWQGQLPAHQAFVLWRLHDGPMFARELKLDTLVIDLQAQQIRATFRAVLSARLGVRAVASYLSQAGRLTEFVPPEELQHIQQDGPVGR